MDPGEDRPLRARRRDEPLGGGRARERPAVALAGLQWEQIDGQRELDLGCVVAAARAATRLRDGGIGRHPARRLRGRLRAVTAMTGPDNARALRVLEKLGVHARGRDHVRGLPVRLLRAAALAFPRAHPRAPLLPHRSRLERADAREGAVARRRRGDRRSRGRGRGRGQGRRHASSPSPRWRRGRLGRTTALRVNGRSTPWWEDDLRAAAEARPDVVVLPKVESAEDVSAAAELLPDGIGLEAQIETARGLVEAERIAAAGHGLEALVFGPADLAASLGVPVLTIGAGSDRLRPRARGRGGARLGPPGARRAARAARRRPRARPLRATRARARLRRQVGDPPEPDRAGQPHLHAVAGRRRAREADPRGGRRERPASRESSSTRPRARLAESLLSRRAELLS